MTMNRNTDASHTIPGPDTSQYATGSSNPATHSGNTTTTDDMSESSFGASQAAGSSSTVWMISPMSTLYEPHQHEPQSFRLASALMQSGNLLEGAIPQYSHMLNVLGFYPQLFIDSQGHAMQGDGGE